tara:strand:- start:98 stop:622 length:525 start_codon:yes stop_codon:yes gene_type:complete
MNTSLVMDTLMGVQPTKIGDYQLDPVYVQSKDCKESQIFPNPGFHCNVVYEKFKVVDNESTLLGLDRPLTKQEPVIAPKVEPPVKIQSKPVVNSNEFYAFEPLWTREKKPSNIFAGINIDRFEYPLHEPQKLKDIVFNESQRGGMNTSLYAKDCQINTCGDLMKLTKNGYGNTC